MADSNEIIELTLIQAVEYFSLPLSMKNIAKKIWKGSEKDTPKGWKDKFVKKGLMVK